MMEKIFMYVMAALGVVIVILNLVAPITKTEWDNKAVAFLRKLEEALLKVILPQVRELMKPPAPRMSD